jgi:hypothetical protein
MMDDIGKSKWWASAAAFGLVLLFALGAWADGTLSPKPTPYSMDLYGEIGGAVPGDLLTVRDSQGTLCGSFTITREGRYGFLHVFGDDRATPADEGALPGEPLRFSLNHDALTPVAPEAIFWRVDSRERVDFRR